MALLSRMGIIERAHGLLASNFNALISRFEEPGRDIALLLSEMQEQIRVAERELIRVMGERKRSESKLGEISERVELWERRAELAVKQGDDALAREALAQRQRYGKELEAVAGNRAQLQSTALTMKAEIDRMRRTHQDYSARQNTLSVQVNQARAGGGASGLGAKAGSHNFDAFDRIANAIENDEALVAAQGEVEQLMDQTSLGKMTRSALEDQFQQLERDADASASNDEPAAAAGSGTPRVRVET